ncbi:MAG: hypothetical protein ABH812_02980 [bacterium]
MTERLGPSQKPIEQNPKVLDQLAKKDIVTDPLAKRIQSLFNLVGLPLKEIDQGMGLQNRIYRNAGMRVGCLYMRIFGDGFDKDDKQERRKKYLSSIINGDKTLSFKEHIKIINDARLLIPHALLLGQLESSDMLTLESLLSLSLLCAEADRDVRKKVKRIIKKDPVASKLYEQYGSYFKRNLVNSISLIPVHEEPAYGGPKGSARLPNIYK